jgi:hypothetical protein
LWSRGSSAGILSAFLLSRLSPKLQVICSQRFQTKRLLRAVAAQQSAATPLAATFAKSPATADSKPLIQLLTLLDATLTEK